MAREEGWNAKQARIRSGINDLVVMQGTQVAGKQPESDYVLHKDSKIYQNHLVSNS